MAEAGAPFETESTSNSNNDDDYIEFLIFIKVLAIWSMIASNFIIRDVYHKLCKNKETLSPAPSPAPSVSASSSRRRRSSSSWAEIVAMVRKISLTQSILVCLSVGDFFR